METERTTLSDNETILNVLLIEQDPMDAIIIRKTLGEDKKTYSIRQVRDGVAAIDYLRNREIGKNNPTPDLIVMAENIPGLNGGQLMMLLNSDAALRQIPLILIQPNHDKSSTAGRFR